MLAEREHPVNGASIFVARVARARHANASGSPQVGDVEEGEVAPDRLQWSRTAALAHETVGSCGSNMMFGEGAAEKDVRIHFAWTTLGVRGEALRIGPPSTTTMAWAALMGAMFEATGSASAARRAWADRGCQRPCQRSAQDRRRSARQGWFPVRQRVAGQRRSPEASERGAAPRCANLEHAKINEERLSKTRGRAKKCTIFV